MTAPVKPSLSRQQWSISVLVRHGLMHAGIRASEVQLILDDACAAIETLAWLERNAEAVKRAAKSKGAA